MISILKKVWFKIQQITEDLVNKIQIQDYFVLSTLVMMYGNKEYKTVFFQELGFV